MKHPYISIVVPLYRCSASVSRLAGRLVKTLDPVTADFEIVFVNDASPENDWEMVQQQSLSDKRIKGRTATPQFK